jgi:hypothetical protein
LKEIDKRNCENIQKEIEEGEQFVDDSLDIDLKFLVALRSWWSLNEWDR